MSCSSPVLSIVAALFAATSAAAAPLADALAPFTAAGLAGKGPAEASGDRASQRSWPVPTGTDSALPGNGVAQHPMLYAGEGYNVLLLIAGGKIIWTYDTGKGGEIDDVWMLTNGHILYTRQSYVEEITPQKKVVWHYDAPTGTEIHSCQPIGVDRVL